MKSENIFLFSVLHVAVKGGYDQVVYNIIQLVNQLPPTEKPFLNSCNWHDEVRLFTNTNDINNIM